MEHNSVRWDKNKKIIRQVIEGEHKTSDAQWAVDRLKKIADDHPGAPMMVEFLKGSKMSPGAIGLYTKLGKDFKGGNIAFVTEEPGLKKVALSIISSGGFMQPMKFFKEERLAEYWLKTGVASRSKPIIGAMFIFVLLLAGVLLASMSLGSTLEEDERELFLSETNQVLAQSEVLFNEYEALLQSLRAFFGASNHVSRDEWTTFTEALLMNTNLQSVEALGFIRHIEEDELDAYVQEVQNDDFFSEVFRENFQVFPEGESEEYFIADYIAPWNEDNTAYGYNIYSNESRRRVLTEAIERNTLVMTEPINLVDSDGIGFLIMLPAYENGQPIETLKQRREHVIGVYTLVFSSQEFLEEVTTNIYNAESMGVTIRDVSNGRICAFLNGSCEEGAWEHGTNNAKFTSKEEVTFGGRTWEYIFGAESVRQLSIWARGDLISLGVGSTVAFLVALLFLSIGRTRERAEMRAEELVADYTSVSERLRLATESAQMGIWDWDVVNDELTWDQQMYALYGVRAEDFSGAFKAWENGLHPADKEKSTKEIALALEGKKEFNTTFRVLWPDQSVHYIRAYGLVQRDSKGKAERMIGVNWNVTHEMEVDKAKSEFVSLASHQLRTPLSSINWYTEMLLAGDAGRTTKKQKEFLGEIEASSQRMVELVNALLNVSRLELGTFMVQPEETDVVALAEQVLKELAPALNERKQTLTKKVDKKIGNIDVDPKLMGIIFQNLLTNAVKYTQEGGEIELGMKRDEGTIQIHVKDNGLGIPESQKAKIFTKLFRADNVRAQDTEGTGLGLYIVKSILDETGGAITFESTQGKGTTFYVTIPLSGMRRKQGTRALS